MHITTLKLVHINKEHLSAKHVATWFAENAVFGQLVSAACNSVSIEIKVLRGATNKPN